MPFLCFCAAMRTLTAIVLLSGVPLSSHGQELFTAVAGASYMNRYTAYGMDLTNELPAAGASLSLSRSGFSVGADALQTLGTDGEFQYWSLSGEYTLELLPILSVEAGFTHFEYASDSISILAPYKNAATLALDLDAGILGAGIAYERYLGGDGGSFVSASLSTFIDLGPVWVLPLVHATYMSQEVEERLLKGGSGGGSGSGSGGGGTVTTTTKTITGLSSISLHAVIIVPLLDGLTFRIHPSYLYSPKSELSSSQSNVIWSAGLQYRISV